MMMTALYRQLCSTSPDANGPDSFYEIATAASTVIDADEAPLSFEALTCLRRKLKANEGLAEQYSIVLARDVYADFVALMTGVGSPPSPIRSPSASSGTSTACGSSSRTTRPRGTGSSSRPTWRPPPALRERISPGVARGVLIGSTHAQGGRRLEQQRDPRE